MSESTEQANLKKALLEEIANACDRHEVDSNLTNAILQSVMLVLANHQMKDARKTRKEQILSVIQEKLPEYWKTDQVGLTSFASNLAVYEADRWHKLSLTSSAMYERYIGIDSYKNTEGQIDLDRIGVLLQKMEEAGLIDVSFTYVVEDEEGEDKDWIELEREDIPVEGEIAISPITGKPDPLFHECIIRHYSIGRALKQLYSVD